jgi:hypothetical protein
MKLTRLRMLFIAVLVGMICGPLTVAFASWLQSGTGSGQSKAVSVGPGAPPVVSVSGRTVALSWSASTFSNGAALSGYAVARYDATGTVLQSIAAGSCSGVVSTTSCTETNVPSGTWKYAVTPAVGNWRGTTSSLVSVTVAGPSLTLSPAATTVAASLSGSIASFNPGGSLEFRLDDATSGTVLSGTVAGTATPTAVPTGASATVTVALPAATTPGAHTVYAVSGSDVASASVTVNASVVPAPTITAGPGQPTKLTSASFDFTGSGTSYNCALDGGPAVPCTSPKTYSGLSSATHTFAVVAINAGGTSSAAATYTWIVDTVVPTVTRAFPANLTAYNATTYAAGCAAAPGICGTAADTGSGVSSVSVLVLPSTGGYWNGSAFVSGSPAPVVAAGAASWNLPVPSGALTNGTSYTVQVFSTDAAGNSSATASSSFTYDTTAPPTPTIGGGPASPTTATTASFTLADAESPTTLFCTLDAGSAAACTSPVSYSALGTGNHTLSVVAMDPAGNTSAAASKAWVVDVTAPTATVTFPVNGSPYNATTYTAGCTAGTGDICGTTADVGTSVTSVQVSIQSSNGMYYAGGNFPSGFSSATEVFRPFSGTNAAWTVALPSTALSDTFSYTVRVRVTDLVGNTSTKVSTFSFDTTAPTAPTVAGGPGTPTTTTSATFTVTHTDNTVTFTCTLDGVTAACVSPVTYTGLLSGPHTFLAKAVDQAGNSSPASQTIGWTVDTTPPTAVVTFPVNGSFHNQTRYNAGCTAGTGDICGTTADAHTTVNSVQVSIRAGAGNYYDGSTFGSATEVLRSIVVGSTFASWRVALPATALTDGTTYTIKVYVTDTVGNASTTASSFTYDTTVPTASAVTTANVAGGTVGRAEAGDTITYQFSEVIDPTSVLAGWNGSSTNVIVAILNNSGAGGGDRVLVFDTSGNQVLGSFDLGLATYVTGTVTFGQSGVASTMVISGSSLTVTLGTATGPVTTATGTGTTQWNLPAPAPSDRAGNAVTTPPAKLTTAF